MTHEEAWTMFDGWTFELSCNRSANSPDGTLMMLEVGDDGTCEPYVFKCDEELQDGGWPGELEGDRAESLKEAWVVLWDECTDGAPQQPTVGGEG